MSFTWQHGRQLATLTKGSTTASYAYNESGIRTSKTVNGTTTTFELDGSKIIYSTVGSNVTRYLYDESGDVIGMHYNSAAYYYFVKNLQGDVTGILDDDGSLVVSYAYDPFGRVLSVTGTLASTIGTANPFRYRSYYYDNESGLYYLQSRYYDPNTCRFINADGYINANGDIAGYNMFAYCGNDPVNNIDPSGQCWLTALIVAVVVVVVCTVCLTGCSSQSKSPRSDLANAPDLDINSASNGSYNCYGNAIKKQIVTNPTGYKKGDSVETTFSAVQEDLGGEHNCRRLDSFDSPVENGWYKVAMMCGETDYHFIRLDENGWYNKSGSDKSVGGCYIPESMVNATTWLGVGVVNGTAYIFNRLQDPIYNNANGPLYFAVRNGWDE